MKFRKTTNKRAVENLLKIYEFAAQVTNNQKHKSMNTEKTAATTATATANATFSFAKTFNKVNFSVDITDFEYIKLAALYNAETPNAIYRLNGLWINKSPLGENPVLIVAERGKLVNAPQHLTTTAREILNNKDAVAAIENGNVGFAVYEYESHNRKCYSVRFCDL